VQLSLVTQQHHYVMQACKKRKRKRKRKKEKEIRKKKRKE
jgi:hypothetical protein